MSRVISFRRSWLPILVAVSLIAVSMVPAQAAPRAVIKAPTGVWSGPGDEKGDYDVVAIMAGPAGSQPAYFMEAITVACGGRPGGVFGIAEYYDNGDLVVSGDFICFDTGEVKFEAVNLLFDGTQIEDSIQADEYMGPWLRRCAGANYTQKGTSGDDLLVGTAGNDVIEGRGGNDVIKGKGGIDILCGQGDKDKLIGGGDIDILVGGPAKDRLIGGPGPDLLIGESGPDIGKGGGGRDIMFGGSKPDDLSGGKGSDYANGEGGKDTCVAETKVSC